MSDSLRVKLAKSKVEPAPDHHWPHWAECVAAIRAGWRMPEPRFPILISANSPISSPEKLQELADLPSVPEVLTTTKMSRFTRSDNVDDGTDTDTVQICHVSYHQQCLITQRTEYDDLCVWFEDMKRITLVILMIKPEAIAASKTSSTPGRSQVEAADKAGSTMPEVRFPIVIGADGPISSPEKLQELADLPSVPEVSWTVQTCIHLDDDEYGIGEGGLQICHVNYDGLLKIRERTESEYLHVWFQNTQRRALLILSIKLEGKAASETASISTQPAAEVYNEDDGVENAV
ncbi:hypothetical protein PVAG01_01998 [Phlyctema vagabunda]|uniref:Uncharacterized protein n=1 Tax=Phlyctema vagabunda TaxID=108571 RepID=A0ABR4PYM4_9HELO